MELIRQSTTEEIVSSWLGEEWREGGSDWSLREGSSEVASVLSSLEGAQEREARMLSIADWSTHDADESSEGGSEVSFCDDLSDEGLLSTVDRLNRSADDEEVASSSASPASLGSPCL